MVICMAVIPLMIRLAPRIGMVDVPDDRKVHKNAIPRVGGIGIGAGVILSILLWAPFDAYVIAYIVGGLVLLAFGAWDDSCELGHYVKFVGQFIASFIVIYWGDIWVSSIPFFDIDLPVIYGKLFTLLAVVGVINAVNHSDGLDGLAGGELLMSLAALSYLAYLANGIIVVIIATAIIGGIFGFLRFNTFPAQIFMGDSGSQFLGYSVAVLTIILTQDVNPSLSMALPVLIIGLPIIDILAVLVQRMYHRVNWFRATRNHIHHRLLQLNYDHYQSVVIIYSIQAFFVLGAIFFRYESDIFVFGIYLGVCGLIFLSLIVTEKSGWKANANTSKSYVAGLISSFKSDGPLSRVPILFIKITLPLYMIIGSFRISDNITSDFGMAALVALGPVLLAMIFYVRQWAPYLARLSIYVAIAFIVYLLELSSVVGSRYKESLEIIYFSVIVISIFLVVRCANDDEFNATPMDYLMVFIVISAGVLSQKLAYEINFGIMAIKSIILFYSSEILIIRNNLLWNRILYGSTIVALVLISGKSFISV